ncbi:MAG: GIY-YIG nuclease family protein [Patescibacteria group bacterium]
MYYVYILKSGKDGSLYTGLTVNIDKRLVEHNAGLSAYTKSKLPWYMVWHCVFGDKHKAALFEKYLKTASGIAFLRKRLI